MIQKTTQSAAPRPLTFDEQRAMEAAFQGASLNSAWSDSAQRVYYGVVDAMHHRRAGSQKTPSATSASETKAGDFPHFVPVHSALIEAVLIIKETRRLMSDVSAVTEYLDTVLCALRIVPESEEGKQYMEKLCRSTEEACRAELRYRLQQCGSEA